jgi:hypothetical protein
MNTTDKHGDNTTTTDDNYDDWKNKKNSVMEHNIMAAGANRNRNTATHTNLTRSLHIHLPHKSFKSIIRLALEIPFCMILFSPIVPARLLL